MPTTQWQKKYKKFASAVQCVQCTQYTVYSVPGLESIEKSSTLAISTPFLEGEGRNHTWAVSDVPSRVELSSFIDSSSADSQGKLGGNNVGIFLSLAATGGKGWKLYYFIPKVSFIGL